MKLFKVSYIYDSEHESYLTVGLSEEEVEKIETDKLERTCSCLMGVWVSEIDEVEGYTIQLVKNE